MRRQQEVKSKLDAYRESKKHGLKSTGEVTNVPELYSVTSIEKESAVTSEYRETTDGGATTIPQRHENASSSSPWYVTTLKVLLWLLLWGFFIEVQFGTVFFVCSALFFLFWSLRGSRRKPWEPSAYSVFNDDCKAIEGTLTAEQFERELRYGPASVTR